MMSEVLIQVENVSKTIKERTLFSNISLDFKKGEVFHLIGPSGTGKSTFLKGLVGLVEYSSGKVSYYPHTENHLTFPEIRSRIHYIGQFNPSYDLKVLDYINLVYRLEVYKVKKFDLSELEKYLEYFQFNKDILNKNLNFLSGGELQIIRIIRSFLLEPEALLLDEASTAMDGDLKNKFEQILQEKVTNGLSLISVSHDIEHLKRLGGKELTFNLE
ncbi:MAG: ABC transporter ATP-binding protein [Bacteriovoracaceae bacterium]